MISSQLSTHYTILSPQSGRIIEHDQGHLDPEGNESGLLRSIFEEKQLTLKGEEYGLYTFASWLPIRRTLSGSSAPATYRSFGLANILGLENLYITFSGYWPEKGVKMLTCSFKEAEAYSVAARLHPSQEKVLVVASAGNTGRAFLRVCSDNKIPLLLCIPEDNIDALWFDKPLDNCVKIAAVRTGGDYFDAIYLSQLACQLDGFIPEGGAKNIARRDGMGTTVLSAATTIGRIPDYYFQAVGSGTGAIAAWEANLRLLEDGRYGQHMMKLMLSQNKPFHPIYDAWNVRSREMLPMDDCQARAKVSQIVAKVLSNRRPPYSINGGLFDALSDCGGEVFLVSNDECHHASDLFQNAEGIDIHPAAAVAVSSLIQAVHSKQVGNKDVIMLNITGGGENKFKSEHNLIYSEPDIVFDINPDIVTVKQKLSELFQ